ncbi:MAG: carboxypeptidase regulatory-like domain-containing protein [Anaerolineae bacterium]
MKTRWLNAFVVAVFLLSTIPSTTSAARLPDPAPSPPTTTDVEPELRSQLQEDGSAGYLIFLREKADLSPAYAMDWEARGEFVVDALRATAERTQKAIRAYLDAQGADYQAFWIDNVIVVESSSLNTFNALATSFPEIEALRPRQRPILHRPVESDPDVPEPMAIESNITHVNADDVWALGYMGDGIVVANIDTGVRYTHEALVDHYRGNEGGGSFDHNYNWWDPYTNAVEPNDTHSHGSHTMGTMLGDDGGENQIGMAPGAQWIACQGFNPNATDAGLLECGQFMAAPWDLNGENPNSALRPHVVNNSWGDCGTTYSPWYEGVINAWHAAGIYPVFSNGNASNCGYSYPPGLNTVGNPTRSGKVTGVGSTGRDDGQYATHSNWGPTDNPDTINPRGYPDLKPQVVAPGVSIRSAYNYGDDAYGTMGGTSMSAPHVVGLVALMWDAAPCLMGDYANTETLIEQTAVPIPYDTGNGDEGPGNVPNHATGWGEIDALAAVDAAVDFCGTSALEGTVTDANTGSPIEDAQIEVIIAADDVRTDFTDVQGHYELSLPAGTYPVVASKYGYNTFTNPAVAMTESMTTTLDFTMDPVDFYIVDGAVTDAETGWPLYTRIDIEGYPGSPVWTDPANGAYSVELATGYLYTMTVAAWEAGYATETANVGPLTQDVTEDFDLDALSNCTAAGRGPASVAMAEDFEADEGGYTAAGLWEWGTPTVWPYDCASGDGCWGTNLDGNYTDNADSAVASPIIDLSSYASGTLLIATWQQAYQMEWNYDYAYAEVSVNGGPWQVMWDSLLAQDAADWTEMRYDISAAAGGTVQFRFRYTSDGGVNDVGYYIDDVAIAQGCEITDGGLVLGNVYDTSGVPLNGAEVTSELGDSTTTVATPEDDAVNDGFYTLFAPTGAHDFTASGAYGLGTDVQSVTVPSGDIVVQNFTLAEAATYTVDGYVTDAATGWPLYAHVSTDQGEEVWSDPVTGYYSLTLYEAYPYIFTAAAGMSGYRPFVGPVGPLTGNTQVDIALEVPVPCAVPGYSLSGGFLETFESEEFPPPGWTVVNNGGSCIWRGDDPGGRGNLTGSGGNFAVADSDACGAGTTMDTMLYSPIVDVSGMSQIDLSFAYDYNNLSSSEVAAVDISADGGKTWANVLTWNSDQRGPALFEQDVTTLLSGSNKAQVRFHYVAPGWDWWWEVDHVLLGEPFCVPPATGGLAVGHVTDANTGDPLEGAMLASTENDTISDADGFYTLFGVGTQDVSASLDSYGDAIESVTFVDGDTVQQDFGLEAGWLTTTPLGLEATLHVGENEKQTLSIDNLGGIPATFELREVNHGYVPAGLPMSGEPLLDHSSPILTEAPAPLEPQVAPSSGSDLFAGVLAYGINLFTDELVAMNTDSPGTFNVIGSPGVGSAYAGDFLGDGFSTLYVIDNDTDELLAVDTAAATSAVVGTAGVASGHTWTGLMGDPTTDVLYGVSTNGSVSTLYSLNPATGAATQVANITNASTIIDCGINAAGELYCVDLSDVLVKVNKSTGEGTVIGSLGVDANYAQGLDFDEVSGILYWAAYTSSGELRIIDLTTGASAPVGAFEGGAEIDSFAIATAVTGTDLVPWLSQRPITGTVAAANSQDVMITFDASVPEAATPGIYYAELSIESDTPYEATSVPVTLTVQAPDTWGKLNGVVQGLGHCDGNPTPLEEASVIVEASTGVEWSLLTDENGMYEVWLDAMHNPLTLTVSYADHATAVITDVMVTAGVAETVDVGLRSLEPCVSVSPEGVHATLEYGTTITESLAINNAGAGDTPFSLVEAIGLMQPLSVTPIVSSVPEHVVTIGDGDILSRSPRTDLTPTATELPYRPNGSHTLTHSTSQTIIAGNSVSCNAASLHADNSYMRVFHLPDFGIDDAFSVINVEVGIESATSGSGGTQPATINLYTLEGDLEWANLTLIGTADVDVADQTLTIINIPVTAEVSEGSTLVVEFFTPDGQSDGHSLFAGSNNLGQTAPTYLAAATCGVNEPTDTAAIGFPDMHLVMNVTGTTPDLLPIPWLSEDPESGAVRADDDTAIELTFDATTAVTQVTQPGDYFGTLFVNTEDAQNDKIPVPVTMTVTPPDTWGKVMGTVTSLGYCDGDPVPVTNQEVLIEGSSGVTWTVTTNDSGTYQLWLDASHSPVTITVETPEHESGEAIGVTVTGGVTTTQDFDLRWLVPCFSWAPDELHASLTLGDMVNETLTLSNVGAASDNWSISSTPTWIDTTPTSGSLPADTGSTNVDVRFDSTVLDQPGVYESAIDITSDDPGAPFSVPVVMTATAPADWARFYGTVYSRGYCDAEMNPVNRAEVSIENDTLAVATTDTDGEYSYWLAPGTYTITVTAPDHMTETDLVTLTAGISQTQDYALRWIGPCYQGAVPDRFEVTTSMGMSVTEQITLSNAGAGPLSFEFLEANPGFTPLAGYMAENTAKHAPPSLNRLFTPDFDPTLEYPLHEGFELGVMPPTGWSTKITNPMKTWMVESWAAFNGTYGAAVPYGYAQDEWLISSELTGDTGVLSFMSLGSTYWCRDTYDNCDVNLWIVVGDVGGGDDIFVAQVEDDWSGSWWWTYSEYDLEGLLPGGPFRIGFQYLGDDGADVGLDDVLLSDEPVTFGDVPWLVENPEMGFVPADDSASADVIFDAGTVTQPGDYNAHLVIANDDPVNFIETVPVTMRVTLPETYGQLTGQVTGLGYCDAVTDTMPTGVEVLVENASESWLLEPDASNIYMGYFAASETYTLTVSAPGYVTSVITDVTLTPADVVTVDVALRWAQPCVSTLPDRMDVTLTMGMSDTVPFTITNTGAADFEWQFSETNGEFEILGLTAGKVLLMVEDVDATGWQAYRDALTATGMAWDEWNLDTLNFPSALDLASYDILIWADESTLSPDNAECQIVADWLTSGGKSFFATSMDFLWDLQNGTVGLGEHNLYLLLETAYEDDYAGSTIATLEGIAGDPLGDGLILALTGTSDSNGDFANRTTSVAQESFLYGSGGSGSGYVALSHYAGPNYKSAWLGVNFHNGLAMQADRNELMSRIMSFFVGGGIPWLEELPESDTTPADSEQVVDLLFDAGVPEVKQPGVYGGVLTLASNDPMKPEMPISVTLTVTPPTDWAKLYGTITSLGYCGENPAALEGAEILIETSSGVSYTLTSDEDGAYAHWMPGDVYTVTVSAADHVSQQIIVDGTAAQDLLHDFELRWNKPCVGFTPDGITATLAMGLTDTLTLTLTNDGPMATVFSLGEQDMGFMPTAMTPTGATDDFGYTMMRSGEPDGPTFGFVDIRDFGTPLGLGDDEAAAVPLPFTFNYYGNEYTEVYVSSNGLLSFGAATTDLSNEAIMPHTNLPNNIVALMWDDLKPGTEGEIFTHGFDRCPFGNGACMVVQYDTYDHVDGTPAGTWQAILFRNGSILMQYADAGEHEGASSTTGIENLYGIDGLMYAANIPGSLQDGMAICFAYPGRATDCVDPDVPWLDLSPLNGDILDDDSTEIALTFDAGVPEVAQPGDYLAYVKITSNDPMSPTLMVPITMTVESPASVGSVTGDVYGWNHCDVEATEMEGALVVAKSADGSSWSTTTNVSGTFKLNIDESHSPLTLTITHDGYVSEMIPDVAVVGSTTTDLGDLFLRMDAPCVATDPHAVEVTLTQGHTMTYELMVMNMGAGMLQISDTQGETWLDPNMATDTVEPDSQDVMVLTLDATGMSLGAHPGELIIMSNDPELPEMHVPVTMTVIAPTIQVAMTADPADRADPGDQITYTISLTNSSNGALSVDLSDSIPANTIYVPGSATNGLAYTEATGGSYVSWSGVMDGGDIQAFTFVVQIDADFNFGTIMNVVDVAFADQLTSVSVNVPVRRFYYYFPIIRND